MAEVVSRRNSNQNGWVRRDIEIHVIRLDLPNETRAVIFVKISFGFHQRPITAWSPKAGSQIVHHELAGESIGVVLLGIDAVVDVLQIPIIDEGHHNPQTVELSRTCEGIAAPLPVLGFLLILEVSLQARIHHGAIWRNEVLTAL